MLCAPSSSSGASSDVVYGSPSLGSLSEVRKVDLWAIKTIKKHFKLKQFKECIGSIGKQYGTSMENIASNINDSQLKEFIISTLIQCYYETQDYQSVHKMFDSPASASHKSLALYIQFCIKLQLFEKAKELLNNSMVKSLSQKERNALEEYLKREESQFKEKQSIDEHKKSFEKLSYMYHTKFKESEGEYFVDNHDEEHTKTKQVSHKQPSKSSTAFSIPNQNNQRSIESQSSSELFSLTGYVFNFIRKYKVELAIQVVSFVLLYWLLK